jgi:hypothetical protein
MKYEKIKTQIQTKINWANSVNNFERNQSYINGLTSALMIIESEENKDE